MPLHINGMLGSEAVLKDTVTMGGIYAPASGEDPGRSGKLTFYAHSSAGTGSSMVMTTLDYEIGS